MNATSRAFATSTPTFPRHNRQAFCRSTVARLRTIRNILVVARHTGDFRRVFLRMQANIVPNKRREAGRQVRFFEWSSKCSNRYLHAIVKFTLVTQESMMFSIPRHAIRRFARLVNNNTYPNDFFYLTDRLIRFFMSLRDGRVPRIRRRNRILIFSPITPNPSTKAECR